MEIIVSIQLLLLSKVGFLRLKQIIPPTGDNTIYGISCLLVLIIEALLIM